MAYFISNCGTGLAERQTTKCRNKKKKRKLMTQRNDVEEDGEIRSENALSTLIKTPGWKELSGELGKTNDGLIYDKIQGVLSYRRKQLGDTSLLPFVKAMLDAVGGETHDMQLMYVIQGLRAAAWLTGDNRASLKEAKSLVKSLDKYAVEHQNIIHTVMLYHLFVYYIYKDKFGKAYSWLQLALMCIQNEAPSSYTARAFCSHARMHDILAHIRPKRRKKYQKEALQCYRLAREHCLYQRVIGDDNCLLYPILYTVDMLNITLDMPTFDTVMSYRKSRIVFQRGSQFIIGENDISDAEQMLQAVKSMVQTLIDGYQFYVEEWILIASINTHIRKSQFYLKSRNFSEAVPCVEKAKDGYLYWERTYKGSQGSYYEELPLISNDLEALLEILIDEITIHYSSVFRKYLALRQHSTASESNTTESGLSQMSNNNLDSVDTE